MGLWGEVLLNRYLLIVRSALRPLCLICRCLSCVSSSTHSGVSMIHSGGVQIWEQACSSHFRSFHLKLSSPSFYSLPVFPHISPLFCPTLPLSLYSFLPLLPLLPPLFSFMLSFSLLLFLLGWEEVTELFLRPWGIERWSSLSCNPFFVRPQIWSPFWNRQFAWYDDNGT